jgi:hypothetical protein
MEVFLIDGTYELFRHYYAVPSARDKQGREVGAVRAVLASVLGMIKGGATHIAVATDHVIESFRNQLWRRYKTSEGVEQSHLFRIRSGQAFSRPLPRVASTDDSFKLTTQASDVPTLAKSARTGHPQLW